MEEETQHHAKNWRVVSEASFPQRLRSRLRQSSSSFRCKLCCSWLRPLERTGGLGLLSADFTSL